MSLSIGCQSEFLIQADCLVAVISFCLLVVRAQKVALTQFIAFSLVLANIVILLLLHLEQMVLIVGELLLHKHLLRHLLLTYLAVRPVGELVVLLLLLIVLIHAHFKFDLICDLLFAALPK